MMRLRAWLAGACVTAAVVLAACGGDDDDGSVQRQPDSAETVTSTAARSPTADDATLNFETIEIPVEMADGDSMGSPDAPVTLMLYEDFQCPYCLAFNLAYERILLEEYVVPGKVRLEFRHYPVLGDESVRAGLAAICVADQGVFWPFHNRLFLEQARAGQLTRERLNIGRFNDANLRAYAVEAGADGVAWDDCFADPATVQRLQADVREARQLGLRGTPGVVLNGEPVGVPDNAAALRELVDAAVEAAE